MTAGLNACMRVWRITNPTDDNVGGAMLSGTIAYDSIRCRPTPFAPSQLLVQQGIETHRVFGIITRPPNMVIYERDVIEITGPSYHPNFGDRFRVVQVQRTAIHPADRRGYMTLLCDRYDRSRSEPFP